MFGVFIGEHENKIDSKARLSIPAGFRRLLEEGDPDWKPGQNASMAVVYGDERRNFLEVFTVKDLTNLILEINDMPRGSAERESLIQLFATQVQPATLDETGRIVLSARVRTKLGLEDAAIIIGVGDTFQIWKPETYADNGSKMKLRAGDDFDPTLDPSVHLPARRG